ncbi:MAG: hypothetical protein RML36_15215 [Anaerolineae bacterium]|nr:hypothetical protein [Anaerolineae bacterium]
MEARRTTLIAGKAADFFGGGPCVLLRDDSLRPKYHVVHLVLPTQYVADLFPYSAAVWVPGPGIDEWKWMEEPDGSKTLWELIAPYAIARGADPIFEFEYTPITSDQEDVFDGFLLSFVVCSCHSEFSVHAERIARDLLVKCEELKRAIFERYVDHQAFWW